MPATKAIVYPQGITFKARMGLAPAATAKSTAFSKQSAMLLLEINRITYLCFLFEERECL